MIDQGCVLDRDLEREQVDLAQRLLVDDEFM